MVVSNDVYPRVESSLAEGAQDLSNEQCFVGGRGHWGDFM